MRLVRGPVVAGCAFRSISNDAGVLGTADVDVGTGRELFRLPIELGGNVLVLIGDKSDPELGGESADDESDGRLPIIPLGPLPVRPSIL